MSGQNHSLSYVVDVKANIGQIQNIAKQIQSSLNGLTLPKGMFSQFASEFDKLYENLTKYEQIANKGLPQNKKGMGAANSAWEGVELSIGKIQNMMNQLNAQELRLLPKDTQSNLNKINESLKEYRSILSKVQQGETYRSKNDALSKELEKQESLLKRQQELQARITTKTSQQQAAKSQLNQLGISDQDLANYETKILRLEKLQNDLKAATSLKGDKQTDALGKLNFNSLEDAEKKLVEVNQQLDLLKNYRKASKGIAADQAEFNFNSAAITKTLEEVNKLKTELASLEKTGSGEALNKVLQQIAALTSTDVSKFAGDLKLAEKALENFKSDQLTAAIAKLEGAKNQTSSLTAALEQGARANQQFNNSFNQMLTREQDMANFINRFSYFFSLTGITQTVRRTVRNITTTIKELDSVMTEAAVVTEFSVGDMWDKLPDYTKKASALGTSIKSLYEATTLYYQQGLGEQTAMDIGVETMKMARIANMDASDATTAMTAAIRGFNMEINKTSATRVNDVYSKLAAITASDTEKISTAMSKTASIASSANMEFETTAALLAQIIETTQESPETAGTAMKTIIARFTEVKKLFDEGMLSGEDEEGEAIEINKIDTALKAVGISLKSFLRGEKGIDDIFLELASKWDTLDLATQRYIATTAAGSRQQSRFIAMMSDYKRTLELVDAAQNSTGASQTQFDKTLDSLDSKTERLKNAWNEFTMSIVNSDLVKFAVDGLRVILDTVNKITNAFGKVGSPLAKLGIILGGFKLGRGMFLKSPAGAAMAAQLGLPERAGGFLAGNKFVQYGASKMGYAQEGYALGKDTSSASFTPLRSMGIFGPRAAQVIGHYDESIARLKQNLATEEKTVLGALTKSKTGVERTNAWKQNAQKELRDFQKAHPAGSTLTAAEQNKEIALKKKLANAQKMATTAQQNYQKVLNKTGFTAEQVGKKEKELGEQRAKIAVAEAKKQQIQQDLKRQKGYAIGSAASTGLMLTGMGLGLAATAAEKQGNKELAEDLQTASTATASLGMGLSGLTSIATMLKASLTTVLGVVAAIVAVAGIVGLAIYKNYQASPEGQLKAAEKAAEQAGKEAEQAAESYDDLNKSLKSIEDQGKKIKDLTKGTQEWREAVLENNKAITDMVEKHKELSGLVVAKDGVLSIDYDKTTKGLNAQGQLVDLTAKEILQREQIQAIQAENIALDEEAKVLQEELQVDKEDYLSKTGYMENDNETSIYKGRVYDQKTDYMIGGNKVTESHYVEIETENKNNQNALNQLSKEVTFTENSDKTNELARKVADGDLLDIDSARQWVTGQGLAIQLDDKSFSNLREYGYSIKAAEIQSDEIRRKQSQDIKEIGEIYGASTDFTENLGDDFIAALRENTKDDLLKEEYATLTEQDYRRYAELKGYDDYTGTNFMGDKGKFTKGEETVKVSNNTIKEALAAADADSKTAIRMGTIQRTIASNQVENFSNLVSTDGQNITAKQIGEFANMGLLTNNNGEIDAVELYTTDSTGQMKGTNAGDKLAKLMTGNDDATFASWAEEMKIDVDELGELVSGNLESASDRIVDERKDLILKMAKYSQGADGQRYDIASTLLTGFEQKFGDKGREMLLDVFSSLEKSGDSELIRNGWAKFMNQALTMSEAEAQDLADTISNINWNNPIDAAHSLNQELKTGSASSKEFAQHILQANTAFLGAGSQVRYLLGESEDANAINDELNKIFETHNEITAADIYDLTDQYKSLEKILENTNVSASALAETLQNVQQGELGLHQITSAVIAAIGSIGSLDDMIAGLNKRLSEFNPGIDENFASEFIGQASEVFSTNLDKGAVGNSQLDRYMDFMFGSEWDSGLDKDARTARLKEAGQFFKNNSQNMEAGWTDMANLMAGRWVGGILGKQFNKDKMDELGFNITRKGSGEIELSGYENLTYEEMAQNMSKVFGITEDMAQMFLTDYANYSGDIKIEEKQRQQSVEDTVQYAQGAAASINGNQVIDQSEIEAIAKLRGLDVNELTSGFGAAGYGITNFYDKNGSLKSASEVWSEYSKAGGYGTNYFKKDWPNFSDIWGPSGQDRQQALESLGIPELETITKEQYDAYQDAIGEGRDPATAAGLSEAQLNAIKELDKGVFDMAALEDELAKSGLSEAVQEQIKNGALAGFTDSVDESGRATEPYEVQARMSDGSLKNITVEAGKTFEEAYNAAETEHQNDQLAQSLTKAFVQAAADGAEVSVKPIVDTGAIETQLRNQTYSVTINGIISLPGGGSIAGPSGGTDAMGQKPHIGPSYPAYASGLQSAKRTHAALTGELGPELIWRRSRNEFYLSGTRGPEMTTVHPSDTVYTAEETKKILNRPNGPKMPGFASGVKGPAYSTSYGDAKTSGGKSTKKGSKDWENPFDKLYNLVRKIDEELRERERIERRYEKLLEDLEVSANKIIDVSRQQLIQLEKERKLQEKLIEGRKEQIDAYQKENEDYKKYASVTYDEMGDALLRINWELIDAIKNAEEGKEVQDYVNQLEEWTDSLTEAEDALWEIEDTIEEIKERGEDTYFDLEGKIKDAVEKSYQDQIDKLEAINDSINDTNADLLDGIQKTIDKQRQDRENEKAEEELGDKQRRLSYLQMDTSGANAMEILQLQKEIEEGQEDYTNTLIDQKISELQLQNDEAAKQREKQIKLLQAQLDNYLDTGRIWNEVYQLMDEGLDKDTGLIRGSRLEEILQNEDTFKGLSVIGKQEWWIDMDKKIAEALSYLEIGRQIENLGVKNKEIEFYTEDGQKLKGKVDDKGNVTTADGTKYNNVYQGANGLYYAGKNYETPKDPEVEGIGTGVEGSGGEQGGNSQNNPGGARTWKATASYKHYSVPHGGKRYIYTYKNVTATSTKSQKDAEEKAKQLAAQKESSTFASAKKQAQYNLTKSRINVKEAQMEAGRRYATGGLADFTGPAWLDGTKSRPELVLNQRDTQNFLQLKDILSSIFSNGTGSHSSSTENNGDITYDIDINVESIGSDYDIDRVASRVKTLITEDARYRNNNSVSLKR